MRRGLCFLAAFSTAAFAAVYLLPDAWWPWLGLAALLPAAALIAVKSSHRAAVLCCLGVAAGLIWCAAFREVFFAPAAELDGHLAPIEFHVSHPWNEGWVTQPGKAPVKTFLTGPPFWEGTEDLSYGDVVRCTAKCTAANYFLGQPTTYYTSRGVFLTAEIAGDVEVVPADHVPWWCLPQYWNDKLAQSVTAAFPEDVSGFLTALTSGARTGVDPALQNQLARTGTAHLVAVSGMHLIFLVSFLMLVLGQSFRRRLTVCVPLLVFFSLGVGSPSVMRACVLQATTLLTPLLHREADRATSLALALSILLFFNPYSCASIGLQLSFAASLGLTLLTPKVNAVLGKLRLHRPEKWAQWIDGVLAFFCDALATSLGAMIFSLPISMLYFRTLSLVAPAVNLLVIPLISVLFAASLVIGLVGVPLPTLATLLGQVFALPARLVLKIISLGASVPYGAVTMSDIYLAGFLVGAYALGILAACWKGYRRRPWLFLTCGGVLLAGSLVCTALTFRAGDLTAAVLDVGQGQSVVFTSQNKAAVLDCGGNSRDSAGDLAADFLSDRGFDQVDLLILTHFHLDHTGGLPQLFARMDVQEVVLPDMDSDVENLPWILELAKTHGAKVTWLTENTVRTLGEARFTLYAPLGDGGANEEGLSAVVSTGDFDILFTGDMTSVVEQRLVRQGLPRCEVLVAGHHGSASATGDALLNAVQPEWAVISSGRNPYGHPAGETLDRLKRRNIPVTRTDRVGAVTIQAHRGF